MSGYVKAALVSLICLVLAACSDNGGTITVGSKTFGESDVLSNMIAILAREKGFAVAGPVQYPTTQSVLEALKAGDVDVYPGYNGTGLIMLGQNPISDGDEAMARVRELYEPLGISWLSRFGFANNYGLAMRTSRAEDLGIETISDLANESDSLTFGIEDDFQRRPLDGLQALLGRYGMAFSDTSVVTLDDRDSLYDQMLDGTIDVAEVYTTDGQIADYGMTVLDDDLSFFPVYQAAPVARTDTLASHKGLREAINALAGKIDVATMRGLNRQVDVDGRPAKAVARAALAEMGLIEASDNEPQEPLMVSVSPSLAGGALANETLRATRKAFSGREVQLSSTASPLAPVASGKARMALVGADAFFDLAGGEPVRDERFEALAAVGETDVQILSSSGLDDIETLVVGPASTESNRLGRIIVDGLGLDAKIVAADDDTEEGLRTALEANDAAAVLVVAPAGSEIVSRLVDGTDLTLRGLGRWEQKANLIRYPFLRRVRIPAGTYPGQDEAVDTLNTQVVLAGIAPDTKDVIGDQGPSTVATVTSPIPDETVKALGGALRTKTLVDPVLRQAAALAPPKPKLPGAINPAPDVSLLNLIIILLIVWYGWLYLRPERR